MLLFLMSLLLTQPLHFRFPAVCAAAGCAWIAAIAQAMTSADKDVVKMDVDLIMIAVLLALYYS